jgi:aminopeptidase
LEIALAHDHVWRNAEMITSNGIRCIHNLPCEEVFTLPDKKGVSGIVKCTRPLVQGGALIEDLQLKFSNGKAVDVRARRGEDILKQAIQVDDGASYLDEVALVPDDSPVSASGIVFHDALFDENAASHIALGAALRGTMRNGVLLTDDQFAAKGGNISAVHIDLMIGSTVAFVEATDAGGRSEILMNSGKWR